METQKLHAEYYAILKVKDDCTWNDLRKSYRVQVNKNHPDRFQNEQEKNIATDKIKALNTAYKYFFEFYRKNKYLPKTKNVTPPSKTIQNHTPKERSYAKEKPIHRKKSPSDKTLFNNVKIKRKALFYPTALLMVFIIFIFPNIDIIEKYYISFINDNTIKSTKKFTLSEHTKKSITKHPVNSDYTQQDQFFSYGSTIGEVILIQGPPDKINNDIWYYGNSEIHFKDGRVKFWKRMSDSPIKAQM